MLRFASSVCLCALLLGAPPGARAEDEAPEPADPPAAVTPEERDEMIRKGIEFLDEAIWKLPEHGSSYKPYSAAVAGWAYLIAADKVEAGRRLPKRSKALRRIRDYLERYVEEVARAYEKDDEKREKHARRRRDPPPGMPGGMPDPASMMGRKQYVWALGQVGCFLAESIERKKAKGASKKLLKKVVFVLESCQQENGGWGHDDAQRPGMGLPEIQIPKPGGGSLTYPPTLLAASNCALSGLGAACRALGGTQGDASKRGRGYFEKAQNAAGTFPYDPSQTMNRERMETMGVPRGAARGLAGVDAIGIARTSGSVYAMLQAGEPPDAETVGRALKAIDEKPAWCCEGHGSATMALQYGGLLAAARGGEIWKRFRRIYFPRMLAAQKEDGSFDCIALGASFGVTNDTKAAEGMPAAFDALNRAARPYVTAIHVLLLMLDRAPSQAAPPVPGADKPVVTGK